MKFKTLVLAAVMIAVSMLPIVTTAINNTDSANSLGFDQYAILTLKDQPLASYDGHIPGLAATKPTQGHKLDLNSPAAQAYSQYLNGKRQDAKGWLKNNMPDVEVGYEYSIVLNGLSVALHGRNPDHLAQVPGAGVASVDAFYTLQMNRSPTLIGAPALWASVGGSSNAGAGMKVGVIDSGVDYTHPFLTDASLAVPAGYPKCDRADSTAGIEDVSCMFVSNKVLVAKVYQTQQTSFTAKAVDDHGTHVSGTIAGVSGTCAPFVGCTLSGIAPKAYLGNYNVFPGTVASTPSRVIAKAVEDAVADGMDVLNLSLGGTASPNDSLTEAVNRAVDAGLIVAIAAGNSGPTPRSIQSPGIAPNVITVGASTNPHFIGIPVTEQNAPGATFYSAVGGGPSFGSPTTGLLLNWDVLDGPGDGRACSPLTGTPAAGALVLIRRGVCTFSTKNDNAAAAGAIGVIVTNSVAGDPIAMGETTPFTIPGVMVSIGNRAPLVAYIAAQGAMAFVSVNAGAPAEIFTDGPSADILAGFSSIGPPLMQNPGQGTSGTADKIKPDVTAPGVNVYSSILSSSCASPPCYAMFQGTSMATPHVAGAAAVLKQLHPTWSPEQIKSVLVNTAKRPVGSSATASPLANPMQRGGGRIDLAAAIMASATIEADPNQASISLGRIPGMSFTSSANIAVTSVSSSSYTYTLTINAAVPCGGCVTLSTSSLTVAGMSSGSFTLTVNVDPSLANGDYYGDVVLSGGPVNLTVPYWFSLGSPTGGGRSRSK